MIDRILALLVSVVLLAIGFYFFTKPGDAMRVWVETKGLKPHITSNKLLTGKIIGIISLLFGIGFLLKTLL